MRQRMPPALHHALFRAAGAVGGKVAHTVLRVDGVLNRPDRAVVQVDPMRESSEVHRVEEIWRRPEKRDGYGTNHNHV